MDGILILLQIRVAPGLTSTSTIQKSETCKKITIGAQGRVGHKEMTLRNSVTNEEMIQLEDNNRHSSTINILPIPIQTIRRILANHHSSAIVGLFSSSSSSKLSSILLGEMVKMKFEGTMNFFGNFSARICGFAEFSVPCVPCRMPLEFRGGTRHPS